MKNLDQYKKGNMTVEELENFTDMFMRSKHDADRKAKWEEKLNRQQGINRDTPKAKIRKMYKWAAVIAAAILLLLVSKSMIQSFNAPSYEQLAETFINDDFYENLEISRADQDVTQLNIDAITAYNQKDFDTAITHFEAIKTQGLADDKQYFFLALSYLYNGQYDAAIANFTEARVTNKDGKYKQDIQWFLSLAYLQKGDLVNGKSTLSSIKKGQWNYSKAQLLLQALE